MPKLVTKYLTPKKPIVISGVVGDNKISRFYRPADDGTSITYIHFNFIAWQIDTKPVERGKLELIKSHVSEEDFEQLSKDLAPREAVTVSVTNPDHIVDYTDKVHYFLNEVLPISEYIDSSLVELSDSLTRTSPPTESWHEAFVGLKVNVTGQQKNITQFAGSVLERISQNIHLGYALAWDFNMGTYHFYRFYKLADRTDMMFSSPSPNIHLEQAEENAIFFVRGQTADNDKLAYLNDFIEKIARPVAENLGLTLDINDDKILVRDVMRVPAINVVGVGDFIPEFKGYGYTCFPIKLEPLGGLHWPIEIGSWSVPLSSAKKLLLSKSLLTFAKCSPDQFKQLTSRLYQEYLEFVQGTDVDLGHVVDRPEKVWLALELEGPGSIGFNEKDSELVCEISFLFERLWDRHAYKVYFETKNGTDFLVDFYDT